MTNAVFKKWTNAARYLNEKINNNRLIAGRNIQLENTGYGIRIHGLSVLESGDTYKGYFKVIQTAPDKIKIVDGLDEEAANCWEGIINEFESVCPAEELTITADAWIYAEAVPVGTDPWTGVTVSLEQSSSKLEYEDDKSKKLISRVKFTAPVPPETIGKITAFSQEKEEFNAILLKECT